MNKLRLIEIEAESKKRLTLWLINSTYNEMTVYGSLIRFNMALGLYGGYPFKKEPWMLENDFNGFITEDEFDSNEYDCMISDLFTYAQNECL